MKTCNTNPWTNAACAGVLLTNALGALAHSTNARSETPLLTGIDHVTINVPDLAKSEAWYTATLGFEREQRNPQYVVLTRGNIKIVLNKTTSGAASIGTNTRAGIYHVAFDVPAADFLAAVATLRAQGTVVDVSPDGEHQNGYFQDLDGIWLELTAAAPNSASDPAAAVTWLADLLLDYLEATDLGTRTLEHLPFDRLPDLSAEGARAEAEFNRQMLERLNRIPTALLPHEQQILAGILRQHFQSGSAVEQNYWYEFKVTPYAGGQLIQTIHQELANVPTAGTVERANYLKVLDAYVSLLTTIRGKTWTQAQRGIRVPREALPGVLTMLKGSRDAAARVIGAVVARATNGTEESIRSFSIQARDRLEHGVLPAYDALIGLFDSDYTKRAPAGVGVGRYAGGKEYYRRLIYAQTGLYLSPETIHARGIRVVAELEPQLAKIRQEVGYKGSDKSFQHYLQTDGRFLASTPAEVEAKYRNHLDRVANALPHFFLVLPQTPYALKRLDPGAEAGLTYGYYTAATPTEPRGIYHYNGSNLSQRTLATSAHLIYHELVPGHHLRFSLAEENKTQHPLLQVISFGAFEEGWAEYAADLAVEMGAMRDPYDLYGHLMMQSFLACRLVVDTGMNTLGWSRARGEGFLRDHSMQSDAQIASEVLRYSTDIPAQALSYRLGYETFKNGRLQAEKELGSRFSIRAFDTTVSNNGAMPLNVLNQQIDWFIDQSRR